MNQYNQLIPSQQSSYFYRELNVKNKHISELRNIIKELREEKNQLRNQIEKLQYENNNLQSLFEQQERNVSLANKSNEYELISVIENLRKENDYLKQTAHKELLTDEKFRNTTGFKLQQAKREIENLTNQNIYKDNLLYQMQSFYNKLQYYIEYEPITLDFQTENLNTYLQKLIEIEEKTIKGIQYEGFKYKNGEKGLNEKNDDNKNNNSSSKEKAKGGSNKKGISSRLYDTNKLKSRVPSWKADKQNQIKHQVTSLTRTPPRDDDYISPTSSKMQYLNSINNKSFLSRKEYIHY